MSGTGITDPSPLGSLTSIGSLLIVGLPIKALSLPSLGTVNGELELRDLANLESVNLPSLTTIATDLTLDGLGKLTTLDGFSAIQSIHAEIRIVSCPELTDITGLTLASDVVPTLVQLDNNPKLCGLAAQAHAIESLNCEIGIPDPPCEWVDPGGSLYNPCVGAECGQDCMGYDCGFDPSTGEPLEDCSGDQICEDNRCVDEDD